MSHYSQNEMCVIVCQLLQFFMIGKYAANVTLINISCNTNEMIIIDSISGQVFINFVIFMAIMTIL